MTVTFGLLGAVSLTNDCVRYGLHGCCFSYNLLFQIWSSWLLFLLQIIVSNVVFLVAVSLTNYCVKCDLLGCCFSYKLLCQIWSSWLLFLLQITVSNVVLVAAVSLTNDCQIWSTWLLFLLQICSFAKETAHLMMMKVMMILMIVMMLAALATFFQKSLYTPVAATSSFKSVCCSHKLPI